MTELWNRLRAAFGNLSRRERILISSVGGLLVLTLVWLLTIPVRSAGEGVEMELASVEQELAVMKRLRREYDEVDHRLATVEERIRRSPRGNLRTTLENLARQANVKVESMEPQASPSNASYRETKVEVALVGATLAQAVNYLHQIEVASQVLSIKTLRLRARQDTPDLLDVRFTVSSFEPL